MGYFSSELKIPPHFGSMLDFGFLGPETKAEEEPAHPQLTSVHPPEFQSDHVLENISAHISFSPTAKRFYVPLNPLVSVSMTFRMKVDGHKSNLT